MDSDTTNVIKLEIGDIKVFCSITEDELNAISRYCEKIHASPQDYFSSLLESEIRHIKTAAEKQATSQE